MPVWDLSIRLFHWLNAALFLAAYGWLAGGDAPHEWAADAVMVAVVVHVLVVLLMQRLTGVALLRAMVTGKR